MMTYIFLFISMIVVFSFMAFGLHFSRYRQDGRCCTGGMEGIGTKKESCVTCPLKEETANGA